MLYFIPWEDQHNFVIVIGIQERIQKDCICSCPSNWAPQENPKKMTCEVVGVIGFEGRIHEDDVIGFQGRSKESCLYSCWYRAIVFN